MSKLDPRTEAIWVYTISQEKIMRRFVEKAIFTEEHAKTLLDMIYAQLDFDLDPSLKTSHVGEIMRASEVKVDTAIVPLTDIARTKSKTNPGYLIKSWLRSSNTVEFLRTWETKHNKNFDNVACDKLLEELHKCGLTMTPKLWCERTRAKGLVSAKGKGGGH